MFVWCIKSVFAYIPKKDPTMSLNFEKYLDLDGVGHGGGQVSCMDIASGKTKCFWSLTCLSSMVTAIYCDTDLKEYFWFSTHTYLVKQCFLTYGCPQWQRLTGMLL